MVPAASAAAFPATRWSVVLRARSPKEAENARAALADLCQMYWAPLYAYARRQGYSTHDAEDVTQGFFAHLLARDSLANADPAKGRLRSYLLGAFQHYLTQEWRARHREKRGGGRPLIVIDTLHAEENLAANLSHQDSPAEIFQRQWFEAVLEKALADLRQEYSARGRAALFARLQEHLAWNSAEARLNALASELKMTSGALRVAIFRMRQRYRELVEEHLAQTVQSAADLEEEIRELRRVLGT